MIKKTTFKTAQKPGLCKSVEKMCEVLQQAGRDHFQINNSYETCLCALIMMFDPASKTIKVLEALPYNSTKHIDKLDVVNTMARLGYFSRVIRGRAKHIDPRLLPCLIVPENAAPYVLHNYDEKSGETSDYLKNLEDAGNEVADIYVFKPYDHNRKSTSKFIRAGTGHGWFRALMHRFHASFKQVFICGFFLNVIALTTPLFIMLVYDRVIAANTVHILPMLFIGVAASIIFEWKLRRIRSRGLSWIAGRIDNLIGNKIFTNLLGLSPELIERASVSSQIARIKTFEAIRDFFSGSVFLSLLELPFVLIAAVVIYAIAGPLVFVPLAMGALYMCLFLSIRHKVKTVIRLAAKATSARQSFTIESLEKIEAVRNLGMTDRWLKRYRLLSGQERALHFQLNWLGVFAETLAHGITLISAVATVGFGVSMVWAGSLSTGGLVATMILVWRVLTPFYSLCTMIPRLEQIRNSIIQVNKLMDIETEERTAQSSARLPMIKGAVSFQSVQLNYNHKTDTVLRNLSFEINSGELMILTGENGSGKTSILKLIQGMYQPDSGAVQIDGFDIRQLDVRELRRQVAYVGQHPEFIQGSVIENMRYVNPMATIEQIEEVLKRAAAYDEVTALKNGLNTCLGKSSRDSVTSSLRTRLSLARGYLHPSKLLLIDELPNTLLSGEMGENLKSYLAEIKGVKSCIFVSYRQDFMALADKVLLLRRGQEVAIGTPADVQLKLKNREAA